VKVPRKFVIKYVYGMGIKFLKFCAGDAKPLTTTENTEVLEGSYKYNFPFCFSVAVESNHFGMKI